MGGWGRAESEAAWGCFFNIIIIIMILKGGGEIQISLAVTK